MVARLLALVALSVTLALPQLAHAAEANAANGGVLAKRWCAACHVVARDQQQASEAPPFAAIARTPELDPQRLALFLLLPHPRMPDMALSRSEAADLAAYIVSQGQ